MQVVGMVSKDPANPCVGYAFMRTDVGATVPRYMVLGVT